jgi:ribonucleoside-triphosphate reductase
MKSVIHSLSNQRNIEGDLLMQLNINYDHNFVELWNRINNKYPEALLKIDGISEEQLDIGAFSKNFMSSDNTANASIDANGNVAHISMATYNKEVFKPLSKLNGYYLMWKEIKKQYDLKTANEAVDRAVSGDIYVHDGTNFSLPYCFNYTAYDIVLAGLPSWTGIAQTKAPKTLKAYVRQVINFLIAAGSQQMGATGIADFLIFFSWFVQRALEGVYIEEGLDVSIFKTREDFEKAVWNHAKSELTSFIYDINFNYRSDQTLFTNVSLYDNYFLENLLSEIKMPEMPYAIDRSVVMQVQYMYMEIMNEELRRTPLTYPVTTATFTRYNKEEITFVFEDGKEKT